MPFIAVFPFTVITSVWASPNVTLPFKLVTPLTVKFLSIVVLFSTPKVPFIAVFPFIVITSVWVSPNVTLPFKLVAPLTCKVPFKVVFPSTSKTFSTINALLSLVSTVESIVARCLELVVFVPLYLPIPLI